MPPSSAYNSAGPPKRAAMRVAASAISMHSSRPGSGSSRRLFMDLRPPQPRKSDVSCVAAVAKPRVVGEIPLAPPGVFLAVLEQQALQFADAHDLLLVAGLDQLSGEVLEVLVVDQAFFLLGDGDLQLAGAFRPVE